MSMPYRIRNASDPEFGMKNSVDSEALGQVNATLVANMRALMRGESIGGLRAKMADAGHKIGQGTIERAVKGDDGLRLESLGKLATYFDVTIESMLKTDMGIEGQRSDADPEFTSVRRVEAAFSNGTGCIVYSEDDGPSLAFRVDFLRKTGIPSGMAVVVQATGISNEPKIPNGAVVLVNRADKERLDGSFFAYRIDGNLMIKRLEEIKGVGIVATAENSDFKPKIKVHTWAEDFEVIGRAVWIGSTL